MTQSPSSRGIRQVTQPGPAASERIQWVEARGRAFTFVLEAGVSLLDGVRRGFAAQGFEGGVLRLDGGALGPFAYVMPALPKTAEHAAYYSDTFRIVGAARLRAATMTVGERDGAPFFHCHALWRDADGRLGAGHILPEDCVVAAACRVEAFGLSGAAFVARHDAETNFRLFGPVPAPPVAAAAHQRAFAVRLRPNQDVALALAAFCRERGIERAVLRGGVGSVVGARFDDGRCVEPFATEMAIVAGSVDVRGRSALVAELDVFLVDHLGGISRGRLTPGENAVLMTLEVVLEVTE